MMCPQCRFGTVKVQLALAMSAVLVAIDVGLVFAMLAGTWDSDLPILTFVFLMFAVIGYTATGLFVWVRDGRWPPLMGLS